MRASVASSAALCFSQAIDLHDRCPAGPELPGAWAGSILAESYDRCGLVTGEYAKTFYLGTKLMTPEKARAVWAIYVWCRRTDELVDGPNASRITPAVGLALNIACWNCGSRCGAAQHACTSDFTCGAGRRSIGGRSGWSAFLKAVRTISWTLR